MSVLVQRVSARPGRPTGARKAPAAAEAAGAFFSLALAVARTGAPATAPAALVARSVSQRATDAEQVDQTVPQRRCYSSSGPPSGGGRRLLTPVRGVKVDWDARNPELFEARFRGRPVALADFMADLWAEVSEYAYRRTLAAQRDLLLCGELNRLACKALGEAGVAPVADIAASDDFFAHFAQRSFNARPPAAELRERAADLRKDGSPPDLWGVSSRIAALAGAWAEQAETMKSPSAPPPTRAAETAPEATEAVREAAPEVTKSPSTTTGPPPTTTGLPPTWPQPTSTTVPPAASTTMTTPRSGASSGLSSGVGASVSSSATGGTVVPADVASSLAARFWGLELADLSEDGALIRVAFSCAMALHDAAVAALAAAGRSGAARRLAATAAGARAAARRIAGEEGAARFSGAMRALRIAWESMCETGVDGAQCDAS